MYCSKCQSKNTKVTCTEHKGEITVRYQRCLDCLHKFVTNEVHVKTKIRGPDDWIPPVHAKLTPEQVREIRKATDTSAANIYELAFEYSVWPSTIQNVIKFKTWKHIK